jgi:predicted nucleotidyltransferase
MLETLIQVKNIFETHKIDYCLIGGLAVMLHNGRANTVDIDFYVLVNDLKIVQKILKKEGIPTKTAGECQLKALIKETRIDILYSDAYIGEDVVHRAITKKLGENTIRVATPEDLIILKTIADRSIDRRDIEELRELFEGQLDEKYIKRKLAYIQKLLK